MRGMKLKRIAIIVSLVLMITVCGNANIEAKQKNEGMKVLSVSENMKLLSSNTTIDTSRYATIEKAAKQVRSKVANHSSSITVYLKTTISSPEKVYDEFKKELTKVTSNSGEGDYMYWDIKSERPSYIYWRISTKGKVYYYYKFNIAYQYYTTLSQKKKVDEKVKSIIKSFGFTSSTSHYTKTKTIYDYICKNVKYTYDFSNDIVFTSYSALFNGKAVCQGYAQLMYKMLKEVKVPVRLVPGYAAGELHGWNIVKIGNYYYNVDATWDAANYQKGYGYQNFLIGDTFSNHTRFDDYATYEFYSKYPMAKNSYGTGKKELSTKSKRAKFKMKKPKITKISGKKVVLKKVSSDVKYTVQYSTKSNFSGAKKVTSKKTKINLSKLKKNKTYYIRFRASKRIEKKTVNTQWSNKKTITT